MKRYLALIMVIIMLASTGCASPIANGGGSSDTLGTVEGMIVSNWTAGPLGRGFPYGLVVTIRPTDKMVAGKNYEVVFFEKGNNRVMGYLSWNQPELNILKPKDIVFPISRQEFQAYSSLNYSWLLKGSEKSDSELSLSDIFSIKIYEGR